MNGNIIFSSVKEERGIILAEGKGRVKKKGENEKEEKIGRYRNCYRNGKIFKIKMLHTLFNFYFVYMAPGNARQLC